MSDFWVPKSRLPDGRLPPTIWMDGEKWYPSVNLAPPLARKFIEVENGRVASIKMITESRVGTHKQYFLEML